MITRLKTFGGRAVRRLMDAREAEARRIIDRLQRERRIDD